MDDWLPTVAGQYLMAWEQARFDQAVADVFGYHALQLGLPQVDTLRSNRIPHRWLAAAHGGMPTQHTGALAAFGRRAAPRAGGRHLEVAEEAGKTRVEAMTGAALLEPPRRGLQAREPGRVGLGRVGPGLRVVERRGEAKAGRESPVAPEAADAAPEVAQRLD